MKNKMSLIQIITTIFSGLCRFGFEFSLPILSIFLFHWYVSVAICALFVFWQLVSVYYLVPILTKLQEKKSKFERNDGANEMLSYVRLQLLGRVDSNVRNEIVDGAREQWEHTNPTETLDA